MSTVTKITALALALVALIAAGCSKTDSSGGEKVIKSTAEGGLTITLASATGEIKSGDNDLALSFADASGKPIDVQAASLAFHMPAMGSMAEMNNQATLVTTETPGKFRARVNIEMAGTWEARIGYEGPQNKGQARMNVQAR